MIHVTTPRETIRVTLPNQLILEAPLNTTIEDFLNFAFTDETDLHMAAICNGELRELSYPITQDSTLQPVLLSHSDGRRIYRRSLVLLLTTAAEELWPGCRISVRYSVPDGGYYCGRLDGQQFTPAQLTELESHMRHIVQQNDPITKRSAPLEEVAAIFAARNESDKVRLLEQRIRPTLTLYRLRNREDYYYGYMLPASGRLKNFRLFWVEDGFILQYPDRENPNALRPVRAYQKLSKVFHQADEWLDKLEVQDMGKLNQVVKSENRLHELILVAEALHEQNIAQIARSIYNDHVNKGTRIVLIAGPSSSGKTTFAKRLAIQLLANGLRPFTVELDNYFVDRDQTPRDEQGEYDFEALQAVNLTLFNRHLLQLINGEEVQLPRFDFLSGKSVPDRSAQLKQNQIIIIEGIHGLNPDLVPEIPSRLIHRVYVSALTALNIDSHNRIPTTDIRLLRRIVRDSRRRGYSATDTLMRWASVRRGEHHNIFPYQENADSMFNSALTYELAAIRPLAEPLLFQVDSRTAPHIEAKRLLSFLGWVQPMALSQHEMIPDTSLLREFIGKSSLHDYHPGNLELP